MKDDPIQTRPVKYLVEIMKAGREKGREVFVTEMKKQVEKMMATLCAIFN